MNGCRQFEVAKLFGKRNIAGYVRWYWLPVRC